MQNHIIWIWTVLAKSTTLQERVRLIATGVQDCCYRPKPPWKIQTETPSSWTDWTVVLARSDQSRDLNYSPIDLLLESPLVDIRETAVSGFIFQALGGKRRMYVFKVHIIYTCSPGVVCSANYAWFGFVLNIFCELTVPRCNSLKPE